MGLFGEDAHRTVRGVRNAEKLNSSEGEFSAAGNLSQIPVPVTIEITGGAIETSEPPFSPSSGGLSEEGYFPGRLYVRNDEAPSSFANVWFPIDGPEGECLILLNNDGDTDPTPGNFYNGIVTGYRNFKPVVSVDNPPSTSGSGSGSGDTCMSYRARCENGYLIQERCNEEGEWVYDSSTGVPCGIEDPELSTAKGNVDIRYVSNVCPKKGFWTRVTDEDLGPVYYITYADDCILINGTGLRVVLPPPGDGWNSDGGGDWFWIKNGSSTNNADVDPNGANLDGVNTILTLAPLESIIVIPDGDAGEWWGFK